MNTISCTRRLEFDAGHRLWHHEGKCKNVHGHRYAVEVTLIAPLDDVGRVLDFQVVKDLLGTWIDRQWDHAFLYEDGDPVGEMLMILGSRAAVLPFPPSAENLALHLGRVVCPSLFDGTCVEVIAVAVYETPNCRAEWSR